MLESAFRALEYSIATTLEAQFQLPSVFSFLSLEVLISMGLVGVEQAVTFSYLRVLLFLTLSLRILCNFMEILTRLSKDLDSSQHASSLMSSSLSPLR